MKRSGPWLAATGILVIIFGTIYAGVQQSQRNEANYPQIQLAEDAAVALNSGAKPGVFARTKIDLQHSLRPFIIVYDKSGHVVTGSGYLHGRIPTVAQGVLTVAQGKPYNFVTWQPEPNVRIAAVSVAADKYYVLSGRSLAEVEKNESRTLQLALLGGLASLLVLSAAFITSGRRTIS